jgi:hypothetical protein
MAVAALAGGLGLAVGLTGGFALGVASTDVGRSAFANLVAVDMPADLEHTKSINRRRFTLQYPGNWSIETEAENYDPDHIFTLRSSGGGHRIVFIVKDAPTDPQTSVDIQRKALEAKILRGATAEPLTHWGTLDGRGVTLSGRSLGVAQSTTTIFAWSDTQKSMTIIAFSGDRSAERSRAEEALALIANSVAFIETP